MVMDHGAERGGIDVEKQESSERAPIGPMQSSAKQVGGETQAGSAQRWNGAVEIAHEKGAGFAIGIEMVAREIFGFAELMLFQHHLRNFYGVADRE
jgi:hypothetical protein